MSQHGTFGKGKNKHVHDSRREEPLLADNGNEADRYYTDGCIHHTVHDGHGRQSMNVDTATDETTESHWKPNGRVLGEMRALGLSRGRGKGPMRRAP